MDLKNIIQITLLKKEEEKQNYDDLIKFIIEKYKIKVEKIYKTRKPLFIDEEKIKFMEKISKNIETYIIKTKSLKEYNFEEKIPLKLLEKKDTHLKGYHYNIIKEEKVLKEKTIIIKKISG